MLIIDFIARSSASADSLSFTLYTVFLLIFFYYFGAAALVTCTGNIYKSQSTINQPTNNVVIVVVVFSFSVFVCVFPLLCGAPSRTLCHWWRRMVLLLVGWCVWVVIWIFWFFGHFINSKKRRKERKRKNWNCIFINCSFVIALGCTQNRTHITIVTTNILQRSY